MHWNCVSVLKIYLFIYRTDMFRLFPSHHQGACYMVQRKNNVCIFQDITSYLHYISVLQFQFTMCYLH
jgi:non-ribosomal peptide synthetase component E (peptide arylation enzyme)